MERTLCLRCGGKLDDRRRRDDFCASCRAKPAKTVKFGDDVCIPWRGDFDEEDNPLFHGQPYMPGLRVCNHRDCVNPLHQVELL